VQFRGDEVTYVSLGDGTTSEGEFWEALNTASNRRLPVIFCVQDNEYAISVPVEVQTAGGNISRLVSGFPNFHFEEVDGTDPVVAYARSSARSIIAAPAMVRPLSMPMSSDPIRIRFRTTSAFTAPTPSARPMPRAIRFRRLQMFLLREGILDEKGINEIEKEVEEQIQADADRALEAAVPQPETIYNYVYSPDLDPTSAQFDTQPASAASETGADGKRRRASDG
jgi:2-oxoisovalerate dehydrogenase E1 component